MLSPSVGQNQAVLSTTVGHEGCELVVKIARQFLKYMFPSFIKSLVGTIFGGRKNGFGIVTLALSRGKIFSKRALATPRAMRGGEIPSSSSVPYYH